MKRVAAILTVAVGLVLVAPATAADLPNFGIFRKKPKPESASKTKQLVTTLQSDPDEKKRTQAAEELRSADPRSNADVVPALIGALQRDPSVAVRSGAVETLGKMKPVSASAAIAMETALQSDPDSKVRDAIKAALWQYHLNGYRPPPTAGALTSQTTEPPVARPAARPTTVDTGFRPITTSVNNKGAVSYPQTPEPPLAKPKAKSEPTVAPPTASILPPPLPATSVPEPTAKPATSVPMPLPAIPVPPSGSPTPTIPVPPPSGKSSF